MNFKSMKSDAQCVAIQKLVFAKTNPGKKVNDFNPRNCPGEHMREDGILYVNDICYGDKYPNSHFDIFYPGVDKTKKLPTIIYMHGGGCIFGDKVVGDPLAITSGRDVDFCATLAKKGYIVINVNYALAPEYRFPVQVEQVNQVVGYLLEHGEELGLDIENIFLGGSSAGANLTVLYGMVLSSADYAKAIGIKPCVKKEQIKGLLIDEAALDITNFEERMGVMTGCWLGDDNWRESEVVQLMDMSKWIGDAFIPSFINSSNQEIWFEDSAETLVRALKANGTEYEYFYRGAECDVLNHGYMQQFATNQYAKECFEHMIAFVQKIINKKCRTSN